jgi:hypothetical protein
MTAADIAQRWLQGEQTALREQKAKALAQANHVTWADVLSARLQLTRPAE